jgi:hypothetical protein
LRVRVGIRAGLDVAAMVERFHPGARVASTLTPPALLTGELPPPPGTNVALARQLLRDAGIGRLRLELAYPPGRNTEAEDAVLFRPLIDAGWSSSRTSRSTPPTSGSARARGASRLPRGVDRRLPGRGQLPPLPPALGGADRVRAGFRSASWTGSPPRRG